MRGLSRILPAVAVAATALLPLRGPAAQEADLPQGVEVLTRGVVHEAFASPGQGRLKQPVAVAQEPPAPIEELPPEEKPDGDNVIWIPGYWAWDREAEQY